MGAKGAAIAQTTAMATHMIVIDQNLSAPARSMAFQLAWSIAANMTMRTIEIDMTAVSLHRPA
jgi:hypothetical protein